MTKNIGKSVFISRKINEKSPFYAALKGKALTVRGLSLIAFAASPFEAIPKSDWIFFYSKNAVAYFFENIKKQGLFFDKNAFRWAAIGKSTAESLLEWGAKVDFEGKGEPQETANGFLAIAKGARVLFPRAANSRQSVQQLLDDAITSIDLIVYENKPISFVEMCREDILVFTSPMNAETYFHQHKLQKGQAIIAIGQTTATALQNIGYTEITIAKQPSENGLATAVLHLLKDILKDN